jgi:HK97 family phage prohead protease
MTLFGIAAVWGELTPYPVGQREWRAARRERFVMGAFAGALSSCRRIDLLQNHDEARRLASTEDGSFRLFEDRDGLKFYAVAPADPEQARRFARTASLVKQRLLTGVSVGFKYGDYEYERVDGKVVRTVTAASSLTEISIVHVPAFRMTRVYLADHVPTFLLREELDALSR